jgi:gamma-glutamyltranspeptidase / glutathione hydrolase
VSPSSSAGSPLATHYAPHGMVCSVDHLASSAGVAVLRGGGSAVDAAIATSAVLAVTTPHMCGMGGDLFALVHDGSVAALDASGRAGSGADPDRLRSEGVTRMPIHGDIRSVPVPGCVDGWLALHERFGRLDLADVLAAAITYASDGFPAGTMLASMSPLIAGVEGAHELSPPTGLRAGQRVQRPGVARALEAIVRSGRDGFYGGEFGEGLLELGAGEFAPDDLARPLADWVAPLGRRVWGADVWTIPPASQGYLTLASCLIAEGLALPERADDPAWAHLLAESCRQAGWDRPDRLHAGADPDELLDPGELARRRAAIRSDAVSPLPHPVEDGGTIHLAVVDRDRMGVSLIQSNASGFGAHLFVPGTGINLHDRGLGFSLVAGHPAEYGPGRRPPHTLAPALVTNPDGSIRAVIGSMGGDAQPQIVTQLLARFLGLGQPPARVVQSPRFVLARHAEGRGFDTWDEPDLLGLDIEADAEPWWRAGLEARGHSVRVVPAANHGMGHAHLIAVDSEAVAGASDWRAGAGAAVGH